MLNANELIRLLATGLAASTLAAGAISCAPKQETTPTQQTVPQAPQPPPSEDIVIEGLQEIRVEGQLYTPQALTSPGMARVKVDGRPLARQRRTYARARGNKKIEEARTLVTMLWDEARTKGMEDPAAGEALQQEALTVLRDTRQAMGEENSDSVLLQMLFSAEWRAGNMSESMAAGAELLAKHPDSSVTKAMAPWIAYGYLTQGKLPEAAAVAQTWTLQDQGLNYIHPYVTGWVAFKQGQDEAARQAMTMAARGWKNKGTWSVLQQEISLIMAHTNTPVEEVLALVLATEQDPTNQYYWLYQTNEEYARLGHFAEAAELLNAAAEIGGQSMRPADLVTFRNKQFNYELVELDVDQAAEYAIQTYQAVQQCGDACAGQAGAVAEQISKLAQFLHTIYSTTLDERYYAPAKKLYEFYLTLGQPDTETLRTYFNRLEETKKLARPVNGKHNKAIMDSATSLGRPGALKRCYEDVLQREPTLTGTVQLTIEVDPAGTVTGVSSEPAAGEAGMGAAAACMQEEVRTWAFPGRSLPGTTRVTRAYAFAPKAQEAAQTQPAQQPAAEEPAPAQ